MRNTITTLRSTIPSRDFPYYLQGFRDFHASRWSPPRETWAQLAYEQGRLIAAGGEKPRRDARMHLNGLRDSDGRGFKRQPEDPNLSFRDPLNCPWLALAPKRSRKSERVIAAILADI